MNISMTRAPNQVDHTTRRVWSGVKLKTTKWTLKMSQYPVGQPSLLQALPSDQTCVMSHGRMTQSFDTPIRVQASDQHCDVHKVERSVRLLFALLEAGRTSHRASQGHGNWGLTSKRGTGTHRLLEEAGDSRQERTAHADVRAETSVGNSGKWPGEISASKPV